ncbi:MAG: ParB/RepB/Spo0J family partition protein [Bacilli bacterium]|nr:ParB/RepB/Spo0J family partition protein [Bacilli bacterium]
MDNVVQNISIEDIIPIHFQPSNEEQQKIVELAQLVKAFGLLDPILVRPKDGKYEIVMGMDKYQAALIAKLDKVPVVVREVDDEAFSKYSNIENKQQISTTPPPLENWTTKRLNDDSDVVNLSELSKIKIEYERDDLKMNNGQLNNNMMNNNLTPAGMNQQPQGQGPTFGGRFFPSLEDEPTNMNMAGGLNLQSTPAQSAPMETPSLGQNPTPTTNNLIDLTDLSLDKEPAVNAPLPDFGTPNLNTTPDISIPSMNNGPMQSTGFDISALEQKSMTNPTDNIINLDNLQNNNPVVQPISEPVSMETLQADFGAPTPQMAPQFDMNQNLNSSQSNISSFNEPTNMELPNMNFGQPTMMSPEPTIPTPQPQTNFDINQNLSINSDFTTPMPTQPTEAPTMSNKDITPVTSTIKNLASSLEAFGYKINITEEDLPTSAKIIIEVEK